MRNLIRRIFNKLRLPNRQEEVSIQSLLSSDQENFIEIKDYDCWSCDGTTLLSIPPTYDHVRTLICKDCGLVQRRKVNIHEDVSKATEGFYYGKDFESAISSVRQRQIHVESRLRHYLDFISMHIDLTSKQQLIDVGGAEGLLSQLIKTEYPHMDCKNIDPDPACIEYGKRYYPDVTHEIGTAETICADQNADVILDFGAIYRANNPKKVLKKYYNILNEGGCLVIAINTLDNLKIARTGTFRSSFASFDPPNNEVFQRSFFTLQGFKALLSGFFTIETVERIRPIPFYHKSLPFIIAKKKPSPELNTNQASNNFDESLGLLRDYGSMVYLSRIKMEIDRSNAKRICLIGSSTLAFYTKGLLDREKIDHYWITPQLSKAKDITPDGDLRMLFEYDFDLILVAEEDSKHLVSVLNFCDINNLMNIVRCEVNHLPSPPFIQFGVEKILFTAPELVNETI